MRREAGGNRKKPDARTGKRARGGERERETDTEQLLSRRMRVDLRADSHRRIGHDLESPL